MMLYHRDVQTREIKIYTFTREEHDEREREKDIDKRDRMFILEVNRDAHFFNY